MKNYYLKGLVLLFAATAAITSSAVEVPKATVGNSDPSVTLGEQTWDFLKELIDSIPADGTSLNTARLEPYLRRDCMRWHESTALLIRELGLQFYANYPKDPRRWQWFWTTLHFQPEYLAVLDGDDVFGKLSADGNWIPPRINENVKMEWEKRREELSKALLSADDAPADFKCSLRGEELLEEMQTLTSGTSPAETARRMTQFNWDQMGDILTRMCSDNPEVDVDPLRQAVLKLLSLASRYSPERALVFRQKFSTSPNLAIQAIASRENRITAAKVTPVEMKFIATDGHEVDLAKLRGHAVLIDFRGISWCGACREEEPVLHAAYAAYHDKGFEIICITYENENRRQEVLKYIEEHGMTWPHYFDGKGQKNPFIQKFGVVGVPHHWFIGTDGLLVESWDGTTPEGKLDALVKQSLGL